MSRLSYEDQWWLALLSALLLGIALGISSYIVVDGYYIKKVGIVHASISAEAAASLASLPIPTPKLPTILVSATPTTTATHTPTATKVATASPTPTTTKTKRPTATATATASVTVSATAITTVTASPSPTNLPTETATQQPTNTPTTRPQPPITPTPRLSTTQQSPPPPPPINPWSWLQNPTNQLAIVTGGGYYSAAGARSDAAKIRAAGFNNVLIVSRANDYRTILVGYLNDEATRAALPTVQERVRSSAYLRVFEIWCPDYSVRDGVVFCSAE